MMPIDDDLKFTVQRRNLIAFSLACLFIIICDVHFNKIQFFGIDISIANPRMVYAIVSLGWLYFLIRFYQCPKVFNVDHSGVDIIILKKLLNRSIIKINPLLAARNVDVVEIRDEGKPEAVTIVYSTSPIMLSSFELAQASAISRPEPGSLAYFAMPRAEYIGATTEGRKLTIRTTPHLLEHYFPYGIALAVPLIFIFKLIALLFVG